MKRIRNYLKEIFFSQKSQSASHVKLYGMSEASWGERNYSGFSEEGYKKNVVANRCISLIAKSAASVDWLLYETYEQNKILKTHPLLKLLNKPNPRFGGAEFFESMFSHKLISGNAYILVLRNGDESPAELYLLRPDRVEIVPGSGSLPKGYIYESGDKKRYYPVDKLSGRCDILHLRNFNPLDDWYGLSQIEAASYSIDLHNESSKWNQSFLQNGARPSGALIIENRASGNILSPHELESVREQLDAGFTGQKNVGRPLLLSGGLKWQEMSLSPKDMDFIEAKNSAARDIALAFGVPPQLLGIKGDNTYNNMQEARLAFWEETIIPLIDKTIDAFNNWIVRDFAGTIELSYNKNKISALSMKQDQLWDRLNKASFLTDEEKRTILGL